MGNSALDIWRFFSFQRHCCAIWLGEPRAASGEMKMRDTLMLSSTMQLGDSR